MSNNIDPLKELKDFFNEPSEPNEPSALTKQLEMEQETKRTGKMTGNEPWFYD